MPNVNVDNVTENHNSKHFLYFIPSLSDDGDKPANKLVSPAMASKSQSSAPTFLSPVLHDPAHFVVPPAHMAFKCQIGTWLLLPQSLMTQLFSSCYLQLKSCPFLSLSKQAFCNIQRTLLPLPCMTQLLSKSSFASSHHLQIKLHLLASPLYTFRAMRKRSNHWKLSLQLFKPTLNMLWMIPAQATNMKLWMFW